MPIKEWWDDEKYYTIVSGVSSFKSYNIPKILEEAERRNAPDCCPCGAPPEL